MRYSLRDPQPGLTEREYNHVFVGRVRGTARPDPDEVAEVVFATADELQAMRASEPFSVWFPAVIDQDRLAARAGRIDLAAWR